jgi:hypothetical protein
MGNTKTISRNGNRFWVNLGLRLQVQQQKKRQEIFHATWFECKVQKTKSLFSF